MGADPLRALGLELRASFMRDRIVVVPVVVGPPSPSVVGVGGLVDVDELDAPEAAAVLSGLAVWVRKAVR